LPMNLAKVHSLPGPNNDYHYSHPLRSQLNPTKARQEPSDDE
jgi:hypothetical protein